MKIMSNILIVAGLILGCGSLFAAPAQVNHTNKEGVPVTIYERHARLEPQQELEIVEVSETCFTFLTEVRFTFTLPLGTAFDIVLPKGFSWSIPSGRHKIDNPTRDAIEYVLKTGACERR
jgi:hypothetical protein